MADDIGDIFGKTFGTFIQDLCDLRIFFNDPACDRLMRCP